MLQTALEEYIFEDDGEVKAKIAGRIESATRTARGILVAAENYAYVDLDGEFAGWASMTIPANTEHELNRLRAFFDSYNAIARIGKIQDVGKEYAVDLYLREKSTLFYAPVTAIGSFELTSA